MRKFLLAFLLVGAAFLIHGWDSLDYSSSDNWIVFEKEKSGAAYDLFYVYPTLSNDKTQSTLDLKNPQTMEKVTDFVKAQTGIFAADARIFAPKVRQLEYQEILEYMLHPENETRRSEFMKGVSDAEDAFRFYRQNIQQNRPFILLGHSQGAMELYELLKRDCAIAAESGFVAAYLIGLPKLAEEQQRNDFKNRGIAPAQAADDFAVLVVWNTQSKDADDSIFTTPNGICINPLNWKTDATPATPAENQGAFFYDYVSKTSKKVPHFCGACVNRAQGALIVDLPTDSEWDAHGFMGKGVFHMNDIWFFAENLRENMLRRVKAFRTAK